MKHCIDCEKEKPLSEFYPLPNRRHEPYCKACKAIRGKQYRAEQKPPYQVPECVIRASRMAWRESQNV